MSELNSPSTELTSHYIAQVTGDLDRNTKEQERIGQEIEALRDQLRALQQDHTVLVNMQQALGTASPAAEAATAAAPSVPHQNSAETKQRKPKKAATTPAKKTAAKKPGAKTSPVNASGTAAEPTLVEVIRGHLEQQSEPRSAAEITTALTQAHPDRSVKTTVVRTTLEGLVATGHAHRTKQGSSVFYTTAAASQPAPAEPQQETVTS